MINIDDNNIFITRGDTALFNIEMLDADDEPYTMAADESIIFTVKRMYEYGDIVIEKTSSIPQIALSSDDTNTLSFGSYKYDVYLYNSTTHEINTFIANKTFYVGEEVHDFEWFKGKN